MSQLFTMTVASRPFGTASLLLSQKQTVHTHFNAAPEVLPLMLDEFELLRDLVKKEFVSLSKSLTVQLGFELMKTKENYAEGIKTLNAWMSLPLQFLSHSIFIAQAFVRPLYEEIKEIIDVLYRNTAPLALKTSVLTANQLDGISEAYSHHSAALLEGLHLWNPEKGLSLQFFVQKHIERRLSDAVAELRGIDPKLAYQYSMVWHARASLEAMSLERHLHTPEAICQEIVRYVETQGRAAKSWTPKVVEKLLEMEQIADQFTLSLDAPAGDDDTTAKFGDFIASEKNIEEQTERNHLMQEATLTIERLRTLGLYDVASLLDLAELIQSFEAGHEAIVEYSMNWKVDVDVLRQIHQEIRCLSNPHIG